MGQSERRVPAECLCCWSVGSHLKGGKARKQSILSAELFLERNYAQNYYFLLHLIEVVLMAKMSNIAQPPVCSVRHKQKGNATGRGGQGGPCEKTNRSATI